MNYLSSKNWFHVVCWKFRLYCGPPLVAFGLPSLQPRVDLVPHQIDRTLEKSL
jgi:hypothetical protein